MTSMYVALAGFGSFVLLAAVLGKRGRRRGGTDWDAGGDSGSGGDGGCSGGGDGGCGGGGCGGGCGGGGGD